MEQISSGDSCEKVGTLACLGTMKLTDCVCKSLFGGKGLLGDDDDITPQ